MNIDTLTSRRHFLHRGAVAIVANRRGELLLHLRDARPQISWPAYWSLLGGQSERGEQSVDTILRELNEEAGLTVSNLVELFDIHDSNGSKQLVTFFSCMWDGDATTLVLTEGVKLQFFDPGYLRNLVIPPFILDGIQRYLAIQDIPHTSQS